MDKNDRPDPEEADLTASYEAGEWQPVGDPEAEIQRYRQIAEQSSVYIDNIEIARFPEIDRTTFSVASLTDPSDEKEYWLSKSPHERLAVLETMRQIVYGYDPLTTRLQRFLEITQRA